MSAGIKSQLLETLEGRRMFSTVATIYLRDSFGDDPAVQRLNAAGDPAPNSGEISGLRAETPNTITEVWKAPSGKQVQTWTFSSSSFDPYEVFTGTGTQVLNGSMTVTGGALGVNTQPDALLNFSQPAGAFKASVDVISNTPGTALGFTSSNSVNNNFANFGQAWMIYKNPLGQGQPATWELHTNGMSGPSVSGTFIAPGYNQLSISYDPASHSVVGSINGVPTAALPYSVTGVTYVGVEGGWNGRGTVDDFMVQSGSITPARTAPALKPGRPDLMPPFSTAPIGADVLGSLSSADSLLV